MSSPSPSKPRVIKDFEKLDKDIQEQIKLEYPEGFEDNLIYFTNKEGKRVSALPFETEEKYYLVRMTIEEAQQIIEDDDDYDEDGNLKDDIRVEYAEKHNEDLDDMDDEDDDPYDDADEEEDDED
ncbi:MULTISPECIES: hypothetical protein [Roseivirga]|jgi:hypothetical protein|uniref:DNA primase n=1 Tax=Roseivirga thermotolerans TaxID=1758176 RepID=A0ABQ3I7F1_9BACT|nr:MULTISPECIES: hypothetical protein [Roseivirga]MEC7755878.1 hypothetical protein [Bacteroidota bacterium]GHE69300.1 hypothetical protein GCM10011340_26560 [Roseivirga thermotolerans]|tara:strand:+ start:194 stop:568 length:375 start_codon:yes stop_codon:yes gene_type:complete